MKRRQFIGTTASDSLSLLASGLSSNKQKITTGEFVFVEAEQFENTGGWELHQQCMELMASAYLLAHGLGMPVCVMDPETPNFFRKNLKSNRVGGLSVNRSEK